MNPSFLKPDLWRPTPEEEIIERLSRKRAGVKTEAEELIEKLSRVRTKTKEEELINLLNSKRVKTQTKEEALIDRLNNRKTKHIPIVSEISPSVPQVDLKEAIIALLKTTLKSVITPSNIANAAFVIALGSGTLFFLTGGSVLSLLGVMSSLGASSLSPFLVTLLTSAGVSLAGGLSAKAAIATLKNTKKGRALLAKKIPQAITLRWAEKLGVPLTENTTYEDLLRASITTSTSVATGGALPFLVFKGISLGVGAGGSAAAKVYSKISAKRLAALPSKILDMLSSPSEKVNLLDVAVTEVKSIEAEIEEEIGEKALNELKSNESPDLINAPVINEIAWGRAAVLSAGLASAIIGLATGAVSTDALISSGTSLAQLATETPAASKTIINIVSSYGVSKVASSLGLTDDSTQQLKTLEAQYKKDPNPNFVVKMVHLLTGGKIHGSKVDTFDRSKLELLAKERGIKVPKGIELSSLRKALKDNEARSLANLHATLQGLLTNAMITGVGAGITGLAGDIISRANVEVIDVPAVVSASPPKVEITKEQVEKALETINSKEIELQNEQMFSIRQAALEKGLKAREALVKETISKEASSRAAARTAELDLKKATLRAAQANRPGKVHGPELPKVQGPSQTGAKVASIVARRLLLEAALLEQTSLNANVVIMVPTAEGAHAVAGDPVNMIKLHPSISEALDGFEFTPLAQAISNQAVGWLPSMIPGVGYINGVVNKINAGLDVTTFLKRFHTIDNLITNIEAGEKVDMEAIRKGMQDITGGVRVPTVLEAVQKASSYVPGYTPSVLKNALDDITTSEAATLGNIVKHALADQLTNGLDQERLFTYIGRQVLWGEAATEGSGLTDWMVRNIGSTVYNSITAGAGSETVYIPRS